MSYELIYTSARRGLRDGSSGFCTVAATEGIPRLLHDKLESLSEYRHSEASASAEPPVNYSHVTVRIQRTVYHIVSRIGDAGIDYTRRTNKIAHHLALTGEELNRFSQGPACMFADAGFWHTEWDREPETLPRGNLPRTFTESVSTFDTWAGVFGDAGWAGVLGQAVADGMKPVSIIVPPQEDTLAMLHEALELVSPENRWKVCFSTYFSRLAPGTQCHWRFILDGTSEARKLRARSPGLLVDPLGSAGEVPEGNPFVEAARAGHPSSVHDATRESSQGRRRKRVSGGSGVRRRTGSQRPHPASRRHRPQRSEPLEYVEEYVEPDDQHGNRQPAKRKKGVWLVFTLFLAVLAILAYFGFRQLS